MISLHSHSGARDLNNILFRHVLTLEMRVLAGQFCRHAKGSLEDVVKEAIRQGFSVYGLSEHIPRHRREELYPEEVC